MPYHMQRAEARAQEAIFWPSYVHSTSKKFDSPIASGKERKEFLRRKKRASQC